MISPPPSADDKAKLLALLAAHGLSETEPYAAANELNKPQPVTVQRPKPFTSVDIWGKLTPQHMGQIMVLPISTLAVQAMDRQDREALAQYVEAFKAANLISDQEKADITTVIEATESVEVPGDSWFKAEFPSYAYAIEIDTPHESSAGGPVKDEQGSVIIFHDVQHCSAATAALIEEARA